MNKNLAHSEIEDDTGQIGFDISSPWNQDLNNGLSTISEGILTSFYIKEANFVIMIVSRKVLQKR